jgi:hypothetical protein
VALPADAVGCLSYACFSLLRCDDVMMYLAPVSLEVGLGLIPDLFFFAQARKIISLTGPRAFNQKMPSITIREIDNTSESKQ